MSTERLERQVQIPDGVEVSMRKSTLRVSGRLGRTYKDFRRIPVELEVSDRTVRLKAAGTRKRDHAILNTASSIVRNLCEGVLDGYTVKLKIVFAHFPITVKTKGDLITIENFQGERAARTARIIRDTKVTPKGEDVIITGPVLTDVTQTAANLQQATKVKNKDHRVFLDGIYVYEKSRGVQA